MLRSLGGGWRGVEEGEVGSARCAHDTTTSDVVLLNEILTSRSTNPNLIGYVGVSKGLIFNFFRERGVSCDVLLA